MKIALIGTTGFVGSKITTELINRNHQVIGISRTPKQTTAQNLTYVTADVFDVPKLAAILKGNDVVISAYNPGWTNPTLYEDFLSGSQAIQEAVTLSGVKRFIVIGGAGSLYIDGKQVVDTPDFPAEIKPFANAAREYLNVIKKETKIDWAYFSPAIEMHQGITLGRTGNYRLGLENPVFNTEGRSILSGEDVAVVIADEIENPKHHQVRFTAAY